MEAWYTHLYPLISHIFQLLLPEAATWFFLMVELSWDVDGMKDAACRRNSVEVSETHPQLILVVLSLKVAGVNEGFLEMNGGIEQ